MPDATTSFAATKQQPSASTYAGHPQFDGSPVHSMSVAVHRTDAVMDVLTTLARLGATIERINASQRNVDVSYRARSRVAARLPSLIENLVSVGSVQVLTQARNDDDAFFRM